MTLYEDGAMSVTIWHNPRCSKCRQTLRLLRDHDVEPMVVEYLSKPPSKSELADALDKLALEPRQLMRRTEVVYQKLGLDDPGLDHDALLEAMVENPILIERPVVLGNGRAALGRPPEAVLEILEPAPPT